MWTISVLKCGNLQCCSCFESWKGIFEWAGGGEKRSFIFFFLLALTLESAELILCVSQPWYTVLAGDFLMPLGLATSPPCHAKDHTLSFLGKLKTNSFSFPQIEGYSTPPPHGCHFMVEPATPSQNSRHAHRFSNVSVPWVWQHQSCRIMIYLNVPLL